jgi:16S rRNA (cytosine967-C5)-methyltransferase
MPEHGAALMSQTPLRLHANLLQHSAHVLGLALLGTLPADAQLHNYFRANKHLGGRDRGFIAETVYGCLRHRLLLEQFLDAATRDALALVVVYLLYKEGYSARVLEETGLNSVTELPLRSMVERVRTLDISQLPLHVRISFPEWLVQRLQTEFSEEQILSLAAALNQPATVDLRVNTHKTTREQVAQSLREEGYEVTATPYSPVGLRRDKRGPLNQTTAFKNGWIEIQDEGSQLLAMLLEPQQGESVVDFCAGAGGKTLQLGALMENRGSLYAFDISAKRLQQFKPRLKRAGLDNVRTNVIRDENDVLIKRQRGRIDRVLVDAPCSGTGTLRRNPDIKWRSIDLETLTNTQTVILNAAAKLLKPGGRLVYATCSLLREENESIIDTFLKAQSGFTLLPVNEILHRLNIPLTMPGDYLRLWPHEHQTDGFFAAVLVRGQN